MLYDYRCSACGHTDTIQSPMTAPHPETVPCPTCEQEFATTGEASCVSCLLDELTRVYSQAGINFGYRPHLHDQNEQFKFKNL